MICERVHIIEVRDAGTAMPRVIVVLLVISVSWATSARRRPPPTRSRGACTTATPAVIALDVSHEARRPPRPRPRAGDGVDLALRGRGNPGVPDTAPDGDRLLVRFTHPNDIRGTGFLVWEHPSSEDERFLYLPSLGRVRRIAGAETQESFVGSDFTYEDIGGRELDEYTYALLDENASWSGPGERRGPSTPLGTGRRGGWSRAARTPRPSSRASSRSCSRTRSSSCRRTSTTSGTRNRRSTPSAGSSRSRVMWTTMDVEMTNAIEKSRTELVTEAVDYNVGLKESDFSRRELERGLVK